MRFYLTTLILLLSIAQAAAQEKRDSTQQTGAPSSQSQTVRPNGEVKLAMQELKKRAAGVLTMCLEKCKDPKDTIRSGLVNGRAIEMPRAVYPGIAPTAHASGEVVVLILSHKESNVMAAPVVSGHPLLRAPDVKKAKATRFATRLLERKPENWLGHVTYRFEY
jgi:outer membrane biosynthesis protein TonB